MKLTKLNKKINKTSNKVGISFFFCFTIGRFKYFQLLVLAVETRRELTRLSCSRNFRMPQ